MFQQADMCPHRSDADFVARRTRFEPHGVLSVSVHDGGLEHIAEQVEERVGRTREMSASYAHSLIVAHPLHIFSLLLLCGKLSPPTHSRCRSVQPFERVNKDLRTVAGLLPTHANSIVPVLRTNALA